MSKISRELLIGGGLWLIGIGLILGFWNNLPPSLPWFYSLPWGEERLIDKPWLLVVWIISLVVFLGNEILARIISREEEVLGKMMAWGGVVVELLLVMGLVRMVIVIL